MTLARVGSPVRPSRAPRPSTVTLKVAMAVTGVIFVGFVFIHMIGNLKIYGGPESLDSYARWLREVGQPLIPRMGVLWSLRVLLVVSLVIHVAAAIALWWRGRKARGPHRRRHLRGFTAVSARTMLLGGVLILAFVIVHLLDLTIGAGAAPAGYRPPDPDGTIHAYANLVASFSRPWMALFYAGTMLVIAVHIIHGWRTVLQDIGITGRRLRTVWISIGVALAIGIVLGNAAIPVLVLAGVIA